MYFWCRLFVFTSKETIRGRLRFYRKFFLAINTSYCKFIVRVGTTRKYVINKPDKQKRMCKNSP